MKYAELIQPLVERKDMSPEHATEVMRFLMGGEATDAQIGGILLGLRIKGTTTRELAAFASVLREKAASLLRPFPDAVDTCGTGGGSPSFNISTGAALVASAAGVTVAKHGNRAVTSACGTADVLEALGVKIGGEPDELTATLEALGIVFMFAPAHHPAMRHVGKARRELGVRTVFNQLGPLANPAGARRQLIGVYDLGLMRSMGEALRELGAEHAMLVIGRDGLDEISPCAPTDVVRVKDGRVESLTLTPEDFGLEPLDPAALVPGETVEESAAILREALTDAGSPRAKALLPNAAAAIVLGGLESDFNIAAERARDAIASGGSAAKLAALVARGNL